MPSPSSSPARRRGPRATAQALVVVLATLATLVVLAGASAAQSATTVAPSDGLPAENPNAGAAGLVFFAVVGIIIVGGVLLYLRNRPPRDSTPG